MKKSRQKISFTDHNDIALKRYLRDIDRHPLLTDEEIVRLTRVIKAGGPDAEVARERFVNANLRYVVRVAKNYDYDLVPLMDLISEGNLGLMQAVDTYDVSKGYKFTTYADTVIRHAIEDALGDLNSVVSQPSGQRQTVREYNRMNDEMMQLYQRPITLDEFCEATGSKPDTVHKALTASMRSVSLDAPLEEDGEDDNHTSDARLVDTVRADSALERESASVGIRVVMLKVLSGDEIYVLKNAMGLESEEYSLERIAEDLNVTTDRVRQIRKKALTKLRTSQYADILREILAA